MAETSEEVIRRYLENAIAAERSFETQLEAFSKEGSDPAVQELFRAHAGETARQHERLTLRLTALGGSPSTTKGLIAHLFAAAPKAAPHGQDPEQRTTQNLMIAFAIENSELAMYESLAVVADAAADDETAALARAIQAEERAAADKIWRALPAAAENAFTKVTGATGPIGTPASA